ncbi:MAG: hypothetical protein LUG60_01045 [Erysipelotrichaceae bacterium]|nr:hypothetical protein [Erysipelotrichaceae bacterium]
MRTSQKFMIAVMLMMVIALTTVSSSISLLAQQTNPVVNNFSFKLDEGSLDLTLDEEKYEDGEDTGKRTSEGNTYRISPGDTIEKDPTVTIAKGSAESYVFLYVDSELTDKFTINYNSDSWKEVANDSNGQSLYIYHTTVDASESEQKLTSLFDTIDVSKDITEQEISDFGSSKTLTVQAYAIGVISEDGDVSLATAIEEAAKNFKFNNYDTNVSLD